MNEVIKSALKTFLPTLLYVGAGWLFGIVLAKALIWILDTYGSTAASISFFGLFFVAIWVANAISNYRIKKAEERIEREYEEFKAKLEKLK